MAGGPRLLCRAFGLRALRHSSWSARASAMSAVAELDGKLRCGPSDCSPADSLSEQPRGAGQEMPLAAELVLATLLETARPGDAGPATVARNAAGRLDTPGGGHIPGDTPWTRRDAPAGARPRPRPTEAAARLPGGMLGACEAAHAATLQEQQGAPCALLFLTGCRSRAKHNQLRAAAVALLQRCALDKRAGTAQHCGNACCACIGRRTAGGCGRPPAPAYQRRRPSGQPVLRSRRSRATTAGCLELAPVQQA